MMFQSINFLCLLFLIKASLAHPIELRHEPFSTGLEFVKREFVTKPVDTNDPLHELSNKGLQPNSVKNANAQLDLLPIEEESSTIVDNALAKVAPCRMRTR